MAKHTRIVGNHYQYGLHLIFHKNGDVRLTRGHPAMVADERAVSLEVKLPLALFRTPSLKATLTVDAPDQAAAIDLAAAAEALRGVVGAEVDVVVRDWGQGK